MVVAPLVLLAAALLPGLPLGAGAAQAQTVIKLGASRTSAVTVPSGKSQDVRADLPFVEVAIGDAEIADVNPLTDHTLSILGKKIGTTRVSVYGEGRKLVGVFDVEVSYDTSALATELGRRFPNSRFRVSSVNGRILLGGTASDGIALDEALSIARQFGPEVINAVKVNAPQQVLLEVRFVEASRSAGRELGVQWNAWSKNGRFTGNVGNGTSQLPISQAIGTTAAGVLGTATPPFGFLVGSLISNGMQIDVALNALEERGLIRQLAEPNLVALSGETANFLAGGEYPIPAAGTLGQISVEYKKYGVGLAFTPTVLAGGVINLKIEPEVSEIDPTVTVSIANGLSVPALTVRKASTTLELRDGQSFVLAGLLQNKSKTQQQQLPWLGDVPVLGTLFSSKSYQKNESDLVIIVTPRLARPARPGDPIRTPLDNTLAANDLDFFLGGKAELDRRPAVRGETAALRPYTGHMLELAPGGANVAFQ
ncbi:Type II/IV secretion system secretin RcpA/CpaC, associated with Flp pilus assembly [Rhodovulum sp. PH10]|uniref:type II and III secretion system protein family protein n=1 Tax=Rhodovulum sp. PH10 TaxID=1187851 RepID=UPI00027C2B1D|nr:type II and III secretion system protein family protein [Rhodovulum sp. PH10]EJW12422.1 Type II/IV secretion system secretin RcpA/CpaC, associated with Flp pilus assembly [Rhodovulum sp. PH10]